MSERINNVAYQKSSDFEKILMKKPPFFIRWGGVFVFTFLLVSLYIGFNVPIRSSMDVSAIILMINGKPVLFDKIEEKNSRNKNEEVMADFKEQLSLWMNNRIAGKDNSHNSENREYLGIFRSIDSIGKSHPEITLLGVFLDESNNEHIEVGDTLVTSITNNKDKITEEFFNFYVLEIANTINNNLKLVILKLDKAHDDSFEESRSGMLILKISNTNTYLSDKIIQQVIKPLETKF